MPAYNFQQRFAPPIAAGTKFQTIRAKRKARPRVGQRAHCFTGMRTSRCRRLGVFPIICVADVRICEAGVCINGGALSADKLDRFAQDDGFSGWPDMLDFFRAAHGLPFHGDLIIWDRADRGKEAGI